MRWLLPTALLPLLIGFPGGFQAALAQPDAGVPPALPATVQPETVQPATPGTPLIPPGNSVANIPELPLVLSSSSSVLLVSNSPETVRSSGVLYRDTVAGQMRVLGYHANGLGRRARLLLLARNTGSETAVLDLGRQGWGVTSGPNPLTGQLTLLRFFASGPGRFGPRPSRSLAAGEQAVLYDSGLVAPGSVVNLLLDLNSTLPVQVSVVMVAEGERPEAVQAVLPAEPTHQRGTFPGAERTLRVRLPDRLTAPVKVVLGGQSDPPLEGRDATTGQPQQLLGNYGVLYNLQIEGAAGLQLSASARGGAFRGSLFVQDGARTSPVLLGQQGALKTSTEPTKLWRIRSAALSINLIPGNGSSLPLALVFSPVPPR